MYHIERLSGAEALREQTDNLKTLCGGVPFRQAAWLDAWWQHLRPESSEPYLVGARRPDGQLCGLLPLYRHRSGEGRTLAAIGDGAACTDHWSVCTGSADDATEIAAAIGRWLADAARSSADGWDVMDVDGLVVGDMTAAALVQGLRSGGALTHLHSRMNVWFKPTHDSWDEHLASLGKTHRRNLRRLLERLDGDGPDLHMPQSLDEMHEALETLITLHQRRWNSVGEPGSYATAAMRQFIHAAAERFFQLGQLRLPTLRCDGRMIAGELRLVGPNRVLYFYSSGMDPDFAQLEPGRILNAEALRYAYRHGLAGVDLMRGDEPYKERMHATPRPLARLRAAAPAWLPRLRHAAWQARFEAKQWVRRRRGRPLLTMVDLASDPSAGQAPAASAGNASGNNAPGGTASPIPPLAGAAIATPPVTVD